MTDAPFFPSVYYRDVRAALGWLERAFGFETALAVTNEDGSLGHCEMRFNGAIVNIEREWGAWARSPAALAGANTGSVGAVVDDADAHCARARTGGARILTEPTNEFYGARVYTAVDPEGHVWRFSQALKSMSLAEMESASGGGKKVRAKP